MLIAYSTLNFDYSNSPVSEVQIPQIKAPKVPTQTVGISPYQGKKGDLQVQTVPHNCEKHYINPREHRD